MSNYVEEATTMSVRHRVRATTACLGLVVAGVFAASPSNAASGSTEPGCDSQESAAVISWNATATAALETDAALPAPIMAVGMAYVQAAVYNADEGIAGGHALYKWNQWGPSGASQDAAVAAAAHRVLDTYFPEAQARVDAAYAAALDAIPDGRAKDAGVRYGARAADHLIAQRLDDGWKADVTFDQPPLPGVWRPTPPGNLPFLAPWLAKMKPFMLTSAHQFRPAGPPALRSARYTRDYLEVADVGSATSATRTAEQTEIARFFGGNLTSQLQGAYRDHLARYCTSSAEAARYLAVANLSAADAVMTAWDAKLHFAFWRPITAIQLGDTDGNPNTPADPNWVPLLTTPPFPDYLSGHCTAIGAVTRALQRLQGTNRIDLNLYSTVTGTTRHYEWSHTLVAEGIGARVWAGIHFRTADEVGTLVGQRVSNWTSPRFFQ
jgi:PAP2 superfamily